MLQPKKSTLRDQLALAADEIIRLQTLVHSLSERAPFSSVAGLLWFGFASGVVFAGIVVAAVEVFA
jgi:hypothetical protein